MKKRILFTGGGGSASQSLVAQWSDRYDMWFADANAESFPPSVPLEKRVIIPFAKQDNFVDEVLSACRTRQIDLVVPGVDEELIKIAEQHGNSNWPKILLPSRDFVSLMLDKKACAQALHDNGLEAPATLPLAQAREIGFPLIAKPRSGRGSRGVVKLDRPEQVEAYMALYGGDQNDYIAQELAAGDEYTVFVAADDQARLRAVIPVWAQEKRGVTIRAKVQPHPAIFDYVKRFQNVFKGTGVFNIQCMVSPEGVVKPFEVNPRISTTFVLGIATGFDPLPMLFGEEWNGEIFVPQEPWSLQRSWYTDIWK